MAPKDDEETKPSGKRRRRRAASSADEASQPPRQLRRIVPASPQPRYDAINKVTNWEELKEHTREWLMARGFGPSYGEPTVDESQPLRDRVTGRPVVLPSATRRGRSKKQVQHPQAPGDSVATGSRPAITSPATHTDRIQQQSPYRQTQMDQSLINAQLQRNDSGSSQNTPGFSSPHPTSNVYNGVTGPETSGNGMMGPPLLPNRNATSSQDITNQEIDFQAQQYQEAAPGLGLPSVVGEEFLQMFDSWQLGPDFRLSPSFLGGSTQLQDGIDGIVQVPDSYWLPPYDPFSYASAPALAPAWQPGYSNGAPDSSAFPECGPAWQPWDYQMGPDSLVCPGPAPAYYPGAIDPSLLSVTREYNSATPEHEFLGYDNAGLGGDPPNIVPSYAPQQPEPQSSFQPQGTCFVQGASYAQYPPSFLPLQPPTYPSGYPQQQRPQPQPQPPTYISPYADYLPENPYLPPQVHTGTDINGQRRL